MKRATIVAMALVFAFAGCSKKEESASGSAQPGSDMAQTQPEIRSMDAESMGDQSTAGGDMATEEDMTTDTEDGDTAFAGNGDSELMSDEEMAAMDKAENQADMNNSAAEMTEDDLAEISDTELATESHDMAGEETMVTAATA